MYLLDSNVCIALMRRAPKVAGHFLRHRLRDVSTCSIVAAELIAGAWLSQARERNLEITRDFLASLRQHPFDEACLEHYGELRARLTRSGQIIGPTVVGFIADGPGGLARGLVFSAVALWVGAALALRQRALVQPT